MANGMSKTYPSQNLKQVLLRIPEQMRAALQNAADENGRSLTAEVLARLETTFPQDEDWLSKMQKSPTIQIERRLISVDARLDDIEARLAKLEK